MANYWDKREENLVLIICNKDSNNEDRNKAYTELLPQLTTMIESIIMRYFSSMLLKHDMEYLKSIMYSHCYEKMQKFDPTKGFNSFSYVQTIIRNYLITLLKGNSSDKIINDSILNNIDGETPPELYNHYIEDDKHNIDAIDITDIIDALEAKKEELLKSARTKPYLIAILNTMIDYCENSDEVLYEGLIIEAYKTFYDLFQFNSIQYSITKFGQAVNIKLGFKFRGFTKIIMSYAGTDEYYDTKIETEEDKWLFD